MVSCYSSLTGLRQAAWVLVKGNKLKLNEIQKELLIFSKISLLSPESQQAFPIFVLQHMQIWDTALKSRNNI
jgi:hypothetical protein